MPYCQPGSYKEYSTKRKQFPIDARCWECSLQSLSKKGFLVLEVLGAHTYFLDYNQAGLSVVGFDSLVAERLNSCCLTILERDDD